MTEAVIEARALTRRFGAVRAVDGLDLEVPRGVIYGLLGPNGSGKSTAIRLFCGLLLPDAGEVRVLGERLPEGAEAVRRRIGYMTQRFSLYEDLTVRENLLFVARVYGLGAEGPARVEAALRAYGLAERAGQFAGTLSGGQKQRLALAAVTLHRPPLLFLDEPTAAVDPRSRRDFWERLFELADGGATLLVSTHYMDEAERCHRLAFLDRGRVVMEGEPRALIEALPVQVLEVDCARPRRAAAVLAATAGVRGVSQLGARLRVLLERDVAEPEAHLARSLTAAGLPPAAVERVRPGLEDVFVAHTEGRRP
ncbi:MAG: ABC transporter ATP-binding protein [Gammaproteobacteria bacterium]|nr:MAG: ABC transporter ATP-binding protein [Gammaproteobacteria bacterium]